MKRYNPINHLEWFICGFPLCQTSLNFWDKSLRLFLKTLCELFGGEVPVTSPCN